MPLYLTRFRYTPETWAMLIAEPEDRRRAGDGYASVMRRNPPSGPGSSSRMRCHDPTSAGRPGPRRRDRPLVVGRQPADEAAGGEERVADDQHFLLAGRYFRDVLAVGDRAADARGAGDWAIRGAV